jgi:hypothetical protein
MVHELCPDLDRSDPDHVSAALLPDLQRIVVLGERRFAGTHAWPDVLANGENISDAALAGRQRAVDPDATALIIHHVHFGDDGVPERGDA